MNPTNKALTLACGVIYLAGFAIGISGDLLGHSIIGSLAALALWIISDEISNKYIVMPYEESRLLKSEKKSVNGLWALTSWIIFLSGYVIYVFAVLSGHSIIGFFVTAVFWIISREISIKKCSCPYCGSRKVRHNYYVKGSELLCPYCKHIILYK
jgi:DNA-directed RNA polymerase subunit RPC12/RpoP